MSEEVCELCDAPASLANPARAGELTVFAGPCPRCGAPPWCDRQPKTPYEPAPGDFVVSREEFYRKGRLV